MKIVMAITGASGVIYGIRILESLKDEEVYLIISENAKKIIDFETEYSIEYLKSLATKYYDNSEMNYDISSGSNKFDWLIIAPCSMSTLAKIASGIADNLITRVAAVALKERRRIIIVPRETPLSTIVLENMYKLSKNGIIVLPASPPFYIKPKKIDDLVNYIAGKVLDIIGLEHNLYSPYRAE